MRLDMLLRSPVALIADVAASAALVYLLGGAALPAAVPFPGPAFDPRRRMPEPVLVRGHHFQVLNPVIVPDAVDVMDALDFFKFAPEVLFHHVAMLGLVLPVNQDHHVAVTVVPAALPAVAGRPLGHNAGSARHPPPPPFQRGVIAGIGAEARWLPSMTPLGDEVSLACLASDFVSGHDTSLSQPSR